MKDIENELRTLADTVEDGKCYNPNDVVRAMRTAAEIIDPPAPPDFDGAALATIRYWSKHPPESALTICRTYAMAADRIEELERQLKCATRTRRDMFAAAALQGLVQWPLPEAVTRARECADALIAELDREET